MVTKIKLCGLTDRAAIEAVTAAKADYAGFVYFPKSPRHLSLDDAATLKSLLPSSVLSVSVLVDPDDTLLAEVDKKLKPSALQLHGKETPERLQAIRNAYPHYTLIKAISVRQSDDVAQAARFADSADMFLFDAKPPELPTMLPGGNGLSFDWALLKNRQFSKPWFLSGGLSADNVAQAMRQSGAQMIDVSSSIESAPGVKAPKLIEEFVKSVKKV